MSHFSFLQRFFGYMGSESIESLCPVRNAIWMGTVQGNIRIIHSPTLSVKYSGQLPQEPSAILKMIHVEEEGCVMVSVYIGEIYVVHDRLIGQPAGLVKDQHIVMDDRNDCGPVFDLVKVNIEDGRLQVWGTMDNNVLLLLEKRENASGEKEWCKSYYEVSPLGHRLKTCSHVAWCGFVNAAGRRRDHLWITYRNKGGMVKFDLHTRKQVDYVDITHLLSFVGKRK